MFEIEKRKIGENHPCFIVAEIGINHNGDVNLAKQMINAAKDCGADCVKFQTFRAEEFMADRHMTYEYSSQGKKIKENMFEMFKKTELDINAYKDIFKFVRSLGLIPLTSIADPESLRMIVEDVGVGAIKLSSEDFVNLPMIELASKSGLPIILSTGMSNELEIKEVLEILNKNKTKNILFLHCVSLYPTPQQEAHLGKMLALKNLIGQSVGYSDHTQGVQACLAAVSMGACLIEKHFTSNRNFPGPDQELSSDPMEFKQLVEGIRLVEKLKGNSDLQISSLEFEASKQFRRSIVAIKDLPAGHLIQREDLALKRPWTGHLAKDLNLFVGKKLKNSIKENEVLQLSKVK